MNIKIYRRANTLVAMWRDNCRCRMCGKTADESDHVFGKSNKNSYPWLLEHWMLRMSLCYQCHHQKHHGSGFDKVRQVSLLDEANFDFLAGEKDICYLAVNDNISYIMLHSEGDNYLFISEWLKKNG